MSSCAVGLVALGVGYLVFLQASKEKEGLRLLGQVIGIVVMIGAVLSGICAAKCKMMGSGYSGSSGAPMCHMSAKMSQHEVGEYKQ